MHTHSLTSSHIVLWYHLELCVDAICQIVWIDVAKNDICGRSGFFSLHGDTSVLASFSKPVSNRELHLLPSLYVLCIETIPSHVRILLVSSLHCFPDLFWYLLSLHETIEYVQKISSGACYYWKSEISRIELNSVLSFLLKGCPVIRAGLTSRGGSKLRTCVYLSLTHTPPAGQSACRTGASERGQESSHWTEQIVSTAWKCIKCQSL